MSEELKNDLIGLGLQRYVSAIINAGYDTWDAVSDMAEIDFDALDIRLGDRRKLQREIARRQLWPDGSPLPTPDELHEYKLSLQDSKNGEDGKNGAQHVVFEAEVTMASSPARDGSPAYYAQSMELGKGNLGEAPKSSASIPAQELDTEMNYEDHSTVEESTPSYVSTQDPSEDDVRSRAMGNHAPLLG